MIKPRLNCAVNYDKMYYLFLNKCSKCKSRPLLLLFYALMVEFIQGDKIFTLAKILLKFDPSNDIHVKQISIWKIVMAFETLWEKFLLVKRTSSSRPNDSDRRMRSEISIVGETTRDRDRYTTKAITVTKQ